MTAQQTFTSGAAQAVRAKVELQQLSKSFPVTDGKRDERLHVLDNIDLVVAENTFLTIIGPSGCGKTTLLRIIASLTSQDGGVVRVDGHPVEQPSHERAMVFQSFGLFPWKSVLDNVRFPLTVQKVNKTETTERAMHYLRKVGLERVADRHPHQLSGGMQQRVGLARALATEPDILLMDEPFGAIDAQTRELMQEELMRLWQETRKTVIFVTHDLDEAVLLSDEVLLLSPGPGRVRGRFEVNLSRPRWKYDVRAEPRFVEIRSQLWQALRGDLLSGQAGEEPR